MPAAFRTALPQLDGSLWLTDGGIETTLIFREGLELPDFAAFHLLKTAAGEAALRKYFRTYADLARRFGTGLILESATWRASPDWAGKLGYDARELNAANRQAVSILEDVRKEYAQIPTAISGCLGPRGDGYNPSQRMTEKEAEAYHGAQVGVFADSAADLVTAITMNYVEEAVGIARAARKAGLPAVISFAVETDGRLPTGQSLQAAIEQVDAATHRHPSYYMINCAHPTHFGRLFDSKSVWKRVCGVRANASRMSHAELNESPVLDAGDPAELGGQYAALKRRLPQLNVMGGCCGTDHRHVEHMAMACKPLWGQSN